MGGTRCAAGSSANRTGARYTGSMADQVGILFDSLGMRQTSPTVVDASRGQLLCQLGFIYCFISRRRQRQ